MLAANTRAKIKYVFVSSCATATFICGAWLLVYGVCALLEASYLDLGWKGLVATIISLICLVFGIAVFASLYKEATQDGNSNTENRRH